MPNIVYPSRQTQLLRMIEDVTEAADTGEPTRLRYAEGLKSHNSAGNFMSRLRRGRASYGLTIHPGDIIDLRQSPDGEEPRTVRLTLRRGAGFNVEGPVWEELKAMNEAARRGSAPWPGGESRVGALNWSKANFYTDFRREGNLLIFKPKEKNNG